MKSNVSEKRAICLFIPALDLIVMPIKIDSGKYIYTLMCDKIKLRPLSLEMKIISHSVVIYIMLNQI